MTPYEKEVLQIALDLLDQFKEKLNACGLKASLPEISSSASSIEGHTSELRIDFYDASGICDVIETFLFKDGEPLADRKGTEEWIRSSLNDVIEQS